MFSAFGRLTVPPLLLRPRKWLARVAKNAGGSVTAYHRDGSGVTAPLISDSGATYTPGVSERRNGVSTFLNAGLKDAAKQTDISGNVTATRKYDAYGMVIGSTGTWKGPFGYSGSAGYQEDETGLQLLGHRYYDSSTGRFITRDPIKDGRNWYAYCDNNPVNAVDATGLYPTLERPAGEWTDAEWAAIQADYEKIKKTKRGQKWKDVKGKIIVHKGRDPKSDPNGGGSTGRHVGKDVFGNVVGIIYLDPQDKQYQYLSSKGLRHFFILQILAHELGHAIDNIDDIGDGRMQNVNETENPILTELGYPRRLKYEVGNEQDVQLIVLGVLRRFRAGRR